MCCALHVLQRRATPHNPSLRAPLPPAQLQPGADAAAVRRRYREMAVSLHPDKCRAAGATDAFQRLVKAYTSLLQFAR